MACGPPAMLVAAEVIRDMPFYLTAPYKQGVHAEAAAVLGILPTPHRGAHGCSFRWASGHVCVARSSKSHETHSGWLGYRHTAWVVGQVLALSAPRGWSGRYLQPLFRLIQPSVKQVALRTRLQLWLEVEIKLEIKLEIRL